MLYVKAVEKIIKLLPLYCRVGVTGRLYKARELVSAVTAKDKGEQTVVRTVEGDRSAFYVKIRLQLESLLSSLLFVMIALEVIIMEQQKGLPWSYCMQMI